MYYKQAAIAHYSVFGFTYHAILFYSIILYPTLFYSILRQPAFYACV